MDSKAAPAGPDFNGVLRDALAECDCSTGTLHLMDAGLGVLVLKAQVGLPPTVAAIVANVPPGKGMAGVAALRREPVQTCDLQTDRSSDVRPGAKAVPVQAGIAIPIIVGPDVVGVLGLARSERHDWTPQEIESLRALAARVGNRLASA